uniref:Cytochrome c oxidase subunit 3 n=1 Tax=Asobara japonica TaxID=554476 RepID=A0A6B9XL63_9HYME|nr:cytochrome c oxidase subunit III [Asobara japonica]QHR84920.1 cytochrome oxidase subunit 3 [Asobara japonica]
MWKKQIKMNLMNKFFHPYHLVTESPWPIVSSFALMMVLLSLIGVVYQCVHNTHLFLFNLTLFMLILFQWWRDVIRESSYQGNHSKKVMSGIYLGMILFILSEVMFFVSFFWTYFHMFLSPSVEIGGMWPPEGIMLFNPYSVPLLNTLILLSSGVMITWSHYEILYSKNFNLIFISLMFTIMLGILFIYFQYLEYNESYYSISDSVFGSIFFMMTGFHGMHVIIGCLFILIMFIRFLMNQFSMYHHVGFELAAWYWHFVDVVWLFLYLFVYWMLY